MALSLSLINAQISHLLNGPAPSGPKHLLADMFQTYLETPSRSKRGSSCPSGLDIYLRQILVFLRGVLLKTSARRGLPCRPRASKALPHPTFLSRLLIVCCASLSLCHGRRTGAPGHQMHQLQPHLLQGELALNTLHAEPQPEGQQCQAVCLSDTATACPLRLPAELLLVDPRRQEQRQSSLLHSVGFVLHHAWLTAASPSQAPSTEH
mmetsp:Transcript_93884/g.163037  ORF Transcript_93884/g.163037 Transcript_93884/m.163037 type:complete len:208 (+) Transcript_93884:462-1085(+)